MDAPATFKSVLVGVDGTSTGRDAMALALEAVRCGRSLDPGPCRVRPATGLQNSHSTDAGKKARQMLERERAAAEVSADLTGMFAPSVGSGLHQLAAHVGADLLGRRVNSRGAVSRLLRGDATRGTLSGAAGAVAVAPHGYAERATPINPIGLAYDGSPNPRLRRWPRAWSTHVMERLCAR